MTNRASHYRHHCLLLSQAQKAEARRTGKVFAYRPGPGWKIVHVREIHVGIEFLLQRVASSQ